MKNIIITTLFILSALFGTSLLAQEEVIVPFSEPGQAKTMEINIFHAGIKIIGTDRNDVLIKYKSSRIENEHSKERSIPKKAKGMKKIAGNNLNFEISERKNRITISSENFHEIMYLEIEVPRNIDLEIRKEIGENIEITNIVGNLNLECNVGSIFVKEFSGGVSASASTGNIEIEFSNIPDQQTMIFNSITGTIDLLLPASIKADLKMRTEMGDIYSDHNVELNNAKPSFEKTEKRGTMKMVSQDWTIGTINGGGSVDISCYSKMGSILLRK